MAKEVGRTIVKFDPNTEAFQMRAQWKKVEICRKLWFKRWSWLLDERMRKQPRPKPRFLWRLPPIDRFIYPLNMKISAQLSKIIEKALAEADAAKKELAGALPLVVSKEEVHKTLKPVPVTSTGTIGWLATKPDCQLEIYTSWLSKPPLRLPDAWECQNYSGPKS